MLSKGGVCVCVCVSYKPGGLIGRHIRYPIMSPKKDSNKKNRRKKNEQLLNYEKKLLLNTKAALVYPY